MPRLVAVNRLLPLLGLSLDAIAAAVDANVLPLSLISSVGDVGRRSDDIGTSGIILANVSFLANESAKPPNEDVFVPLVDFNVKDGRAIDVFDGNEDVCIVFVVVVTVGNCGLDISNLAGCSSSLCSESSKSNDSTTEESTSVELSAGKVGSTSGGSCFLKDVLVFSCAIDVEGIVLSADLVVVIVV